jgi:hypothetical protein
MNDWKRIVTTALPVVLLLIGNQTTALAQSSTPQPEKRPVTMTPVKVDVVISRHQGDKKVASLPFAMWLTMSSSGTPAMQSVRVGVDVPIGATTVTTGESNNTGPRATPTGATTTSQATTKTEYRYVGTQIDCRVQAGSSPAEEGRFWIYVSVSDSSVYTGDTDPKAALRVTDPMAFRSFTMNNSMLMRDAQTLQFATATDKVTGETIRVDVTLSVVK